MRRIFVGGMIFLREIKEVDARYQAGAWGEELHQSFQICI